MFLQSFMNYGAVALTKVCYTDRHIYKSQTSEIALLSY